MTVNFSYFFTRYRMWEGKTRVTSGELQFHICKLRVEISILYKADRDTDPDLHKKWTPDF